MGNTDKASEAKLTATETVSTPTSPAVSKNSYDATKEEIKDSINFIKNRLSVAEPKIPEKLETVEKVEIEKEPEAISHVVTEEEKENCPENCEEVKKEEKKIEM